MKKIFKPLIQRDCNHSLALSTLLQNDQVSYPSFVSIWNHYRKSKDLLEGRIVHLLTCLHGYDHITFLSNCSIEMYGNCGSLEDARAAFDKICSPDLYSWHILIKIYGLNGNIDNAYSMFCQMPKRNDVSWNTMISAFSQNGQGRRALNLFQEMQEQKYIPSKATFVSLLDACSDTATLDEGLNIHWLLILYGVEIDVVVGTALINMYANCSVINEAKNIFKGLVHQDVVSWTAMIAAFAYNGYDEEALNHFGWMQLNGFKPDTAAFVCTLEACARSAEIHKGKLIHLIILDVGIQDKSSVGNALINVYGKCKSLCDAKAVFNDMPYRDVVSWTAILGACTHNGDGIEGLKLLCQMKVEGVIPNKVTFLSALDACSLVAAVGPAQELHATIYDSGYEEDVMMGNALINMYGKCGSLTDARKVFNKMHRRDVVCWTSMIATFSLNGHIKEALDLFKKMASDGIKPNDVTFVCALNACSHTGQINAARQFFLSMKRDHGIEYKINHYVCMIDLLGRAGHLDEAEDLISQIPSEKATVAWLCLLGACRIHGDKERATKAAHHCNELDPNDVTSLVTLSNILSTVDNETGRVHTWEWKAHNCTHVES